METNEIRARITAHFQKSGALANFAFKSIGSTWSEAQPVFEAMVREGVIEVFTRLSPKGRKMQAYRLAVQS